MCERCFTTTSTTTAATTTASNDSAPTFEAARWRCTACLEEFTQIPTYHMCKGPWSP